MADETLRVPQAQTPQQRRANEAYAKHEAAKRGRPTTDLKKKSVPQKSPISKTAVLLLLFVIIGGIAFELFRFIYSFTSQWFGSVYDPVEQAAEKLAGAGANVEL